MERRVKKDRVDLEKKRERKEIEWKSRAKIKGEK